MRAHGKEQEEPKASDTPPAPEGQGLWLAPRSEDEAQEGRSRAELDPNTFGKSPAAGCLIRRLNSIADPRLTRRVGALIHRTNTGYRHLADVSDDTWFVRLVLSWRRHQLGKVEFHEDVDTYVRTLIVTASREWMRCVDERDPLNANRPE